MMTHQQKEFLSLDCKSCIFGIVCCQCLTPKEFEIIYDSTIRRKFKKGESIIKQGARSTHIAYLLKGIVKHTFDDETGRTLILAISGSPNLIGGANLVNDGTNVFSIYALDDCEVCMIEMDALKQTILHNGLFALKLTEAASGMFRDAIFNFISLAHKHVNGRVADIFIYLSRSIYKSQKFTLALTRKELAQFAGISQENVIITLSKFKNEGVLSVEGKQIEILDFQKLEQISKFG
jgi:CRP-like cAMP-binding protein